MTQCVGVVINCYVIEFQNCFFVGPILIVLIIDNRELRATRILLIDRLGWVGHSQSLRTEWLKNDIFVYKYSNVTWQKNFNKIGKPEVMLLHETFTYSTKTSAWTALARFFICKLRLIIIIFPFYRKNLDLRKNSNVRD